jgi:formyltetrahydrofolate deformylase
VEPDVASFGVPYTHIPVTRETEPRAEEREIELLAGVQFFVLARYMQILSGDSHAPTGMPVINIHHSFLPAFAGAHSYARAQVRGVKLVGATAHYPTEDLDERPIIEQDVARVSHRHDADVLMRIGRDIERVVLARAVDWHAQDRVMVHETGRPSSSDPPTCGAATCRPWRERRRSRPAPTTTRGGRAGRPADGDPVKLAVSARWR